LEFAAVPGFVTDEPSWQYVNERSIEGSVGQHNIVSGTICNDDRHRQPMNVCECHDLGRVASTAFAYAGAPLFAST